MSKFFNQNERDWLLKRVPGASPQTPIDLLRRQYYTSYSGVLEAGEVASQLSLGELQWRWICRYIETHGGSVADDDCYSDVWIKMVIITGQTPVKFINQNISMFYRYEGTELASTSPSASASPSSA